ncbi:MAG: DUF983 domain-containing protein [Sphingomonadales bacterium]|jgi:uncharacterized protein (DUF983 family)|nr:DUF983 domain-containing protein [Sphingomonadales bacterium]MBK6493374.1 DUF983 domain-containing protein [Sphingomonadales bacterium]MBK6719753.1 DUF983 domain-containing protein [Sphingomonadales bacterium]MBK7283065.1 DUF983 domain-containing protein [Sphingomonadales bacterium]MBK8271812.1 DUF983 domain-containing protein [Sphingomonadales bacterium]
MADQAPDTAQAAIRGLCPKCGAPGLFGGVVRFSPGCLGCGLDFDQFNVGDGPAAFLIMIVGGIVTILAVVVQLKFEPPFWVHILLWVPITLALVLGLLRIAKGALMALEYRNRAREGRIVE